MCATIHPFQWWHPFNPHFKFTVLIPQEGVCNSSREKKNEDLKERSASGATAATAVIGLEA